MNPKLNIYVTSLLFILTVLIYANGTSGSLYYDDYRPLSQLESIQNWLSTFIYISSETSGPLGRPVSMITFALQYESWPENIQNFLWFNILLHATNGLLVYCLCVKLLAFTNIHNSNSLSKTQWTATFITLLWLLSPIQISSTLITIQRMTGLSAFWVFAGLLLYISGLANSSKNLSRARWQQIIGLTLMTALAVFSKENGILLPVFALVLERTIFQNNRDPDRKIRQSFLWFCLTSILFYLLYVIITSSGIYPFRDFSMVDRILTQPYILVTYLKLSFLPDLYAYNPFHDDLPAFTLKTITWYAILSIGIVVFLLVIAWRFNRSQPVLSFAIWWFFAAHLLESTVIGLELYFEHRNYVALLGPCFAIGWYLRKLGQKYIKLVVFGSISYLLLIAIITAFVVSIWGRPQQAAELWFDKQYGSPRAAEHLALSYLESNQLMPAYFTMQAQVKACDDCIGSRIQFAIIACSANDKHSFDENIKRVRELAPEQHIIGSAPSALASLARQVDNKTCQYITYSELVALNTLLLMYQPPTINASKHFELLLNLHQLANKMGNEDESLEFLKQAYNVRPNLQIGEVIFNNLIEQKNINHAENFLAEMCARKIINPFVQQQSSISCEQMRQRLKAKKPS